MRKEDGEVDIDIFSCTIFLSKKLRYFNFKGLVVMLKNQYIFICLQLFLQLNLNMKNETQKDKSQMSGSIFAHQNDLQLQPLEKSQNFSKSCEQYEKKLRRFYCPPLEILNRKLQENGIQKEKAFHFSLIKKIVRKSGNSYLFKVFIGNFHTEISLLKVNFNSSFFQRVQYAQGNYAQIYIQKIQKRSYVIKSQNISEEGSADLGEEVDDTLKEYFAYKIASTLEYGPKLFKIFGFDIICFKNSVEFSMEFCQLPNKEDFKKRNQIEIHLFSSLKAMHSLHIVHSDIKKDNVSWSPHFQKWIFLDFGFTSFLKQKPGEKTLTNFIGTYRYAIRQMKELFYLKKGGFVDLYLNDIYGLDNVIPKFFSLPKIQLPYIENHPLQVLLVILSKTKYSIFIQDLPSIEQIFLQYSSLKKQFLGLILMQLSMNQQSEKKSSQRESPPLFILYQKLKSIINENCTRKNMTFQGDEQQYLKNAFLNEDQEDFKSIFLYQHESNLKKILSKQWEQLSFMKKLSLFICQAFYSNKKIYIDRFKQIIQLLADLHMQNIEEKNWLWKFHQILVSLQSFFREKKCRAILEEIKAYYHFCHNERGFKRLSHLLSIAIDNNVHKIQNQFSDFFSNIFQFSSLGLEQQLFELKSFLKISQQGACSQIYSILLELGELILQIISLKQLSSQKQKKFQYLISKVKKNKEYQNKYFLNLITFQISSWKDKFKISYLSKNSKMNHKPIPFNMKSNQFSLKFVIEKMESLKSAPCTEIEPFFEAYPICREIPRLFNFEYNLKKENFEKVNEIAQNIYELNKQNLEEITDDLIYLLRRWKSLEKVKEQLQFMLDTFTTYLKRNISIEKISSYWNFLIKILFTLNLMKYKLDSKRKNQILSSIKFIVSFYHGKTLSQTQIVFLNLFLSLVAFFEDDRTKACVKLEKISGESKIRESPLLLVQIIQCFVFYQQDSPALFFRKTELYEFILQDQMVNWLFFQVPLFFSFVLQRKSSEQGSKEVFKIILQLTNYLTQIQGRINSLPSIFQDFVANQRNKNQQFLQISLKTQIKAFRENNYLSTFIFMVFLKIQEFAKAQFKVSDLIRILSLSMVSIRKFPHSLRISLQRTIRYKFRIFQGKICKRKKTILDRRQDYAKGRLSFFQRNTERSLNKIKGSKIIKKLKKKLKILQKNVNQKNRWMTDIKIMKIV